MKAFRCISVMVALSCPGIAWGQLAIPASSDWVDQGMVFSASPLGQGWDAVFEGVTPSSVVQKDGVMYLYYIGADNYISQKNNIGPSHRSVGVATSTDGVNWTTSASPVITFSSSGNPEEGAVSAGVFLGPSGEFIAYYGANIASSPTSTQVNADVRVATSSNGFDFSGSKIVVSHSDSSVFGYGDEVHSMTGYTYAGNYYAFYIPNGTSQAGRLGASWGSSYDNLTSNSAVYLSGTATTVQARGPGSIVPIGEGKVALFNSQSTSMNVRIADADNPTQVSSIVQTYSGLPGFGRTVYLDEDRQTWFMYYNGWSYTGMMTAPAGAPDATGPTAPATAQATAVSYKQVQLTWDAASDPETGVLQYNVYRDGTKIGSTRDRSFLDAGAQELTSYDYQVRPINLHGTEGAAVGVTVGTPADMAPSAVQTAAASGNGTLLRVKFDEPVDPTTASNPSNYTLDHGVSVIAASLDVDGRTVTLTTSSPQQDGVLYTVQASGVRDTAAAANVGSSSRQYTYSEVNGLVGLYRLDGSSGGFSHDTSGYEQHGRVFGSPMAVDGLRDGALRFNGATDYMEIDDSEHLDQVFSREFTFTAWVKPEDRPAWTTASNRAYAVFTSPNMNIEYDVDQKFSVRLRTTDGQVSVLTSETFAPGQWHHLAVAVDGNSGLLSFFIDGELIGGAANSFSGQVLAPPGEDDEIAWMGQYYAQYRIGVGDPLFDLEMNYFKGVIDDVRLFDRSLTADDVAAIIPEPASLAVLGVGALAVIRRRRRR